MKVRGVPLVVERSHALPLVDVEVVVCRGSLEDPEGLEGLTHVLSRLMRRGPRGMRAEAFDERLDRLGATLSASVSHEHVRLGGTVLTRNLAPYLELLGRMVVTPGLRRDDFARVRRRSIADRVALSDHDRGLAARAFRRQLFGTHPYGRPVAGTLASLPRLKLDDVRRRHGELVRAGHLVIGVAGDVTEEAVAPLLERAFADLPTGSSRRPRARAPRAKKGRHVVVVDKPDRAQTQLYVGALGMKVGDPDYPALLVANTGFGGTFTSRLVKEVRSERGWSYGAGSKVGTDRQKDAWSMWTHPSAEQLLDCLALELELLDAWVDRGLTRDEVRRSKRYLIKSHAFERETAAKRLEPRLEQLAYDLPAGWHEQLVPRVRAVKRADANEAVRRHLDASRLSIALVATATSALCDGLRGLPGVESVTTIDLAEL